MYWSEMVMSTHSIWYFSLIILSTLLFVFAMWRKRDIKLVILFLSTIGLIYLVEYFVLILFNSYVYNPGILHNQYYDNIMGAVVSNAFAIPMTAVFITAFRLNVIAKFAFVGALIGVEAFFVYKGIYHHIWWDYLYTGIGIFITFIITQKWYRLIINYPLKKSVEFITLFFSNIAIQITIAFILYGIMGFYSYSIDWFSNPNRNTVAFSTLYLFILSFVFAGLIVIRSSFKWMIVAFLMMSVIDFVLLKMHILHLSTHWFLIYTFLIRIMILLIIIAISQALRKKTI